MIQSTPPAARMAAAAWAIGITAACFLFIGLMGFGFLADSYMNLYVGRLIAQHGLPHEDTLTLAGRGRFWIDQQWLAHLATYRVYQAAGHQGVAVVSALALSSAYGLTAGLMRLLGARSLQIALLSFLAFGTTMVSVFVRAQNLVMPLVPLFVYLLVKDARRDRPGAVSFSLLAILALWANLHGSILLFAGSAALYWGGRAIVGILRTHARTVAAAYAGLAVGAALTPLATPYGHRTIDYYRAVFGNEQLQSSIFEWGRPSLLEPVFVPLWACAVGVLLVAPRILRERRRDRLALLGISVVVFAAAVQSLRNGVWFGLVASVLIATQWTAMSGIRLPTGAARAGRVAGPVIVVILASLAAWAGSTRMTDRQVTSAAPRDALRVAAERAQRETILADETTAAALLWYEPRSASRVAFDARIEVFDESDLRGYYRFLNARNHRDLRYARRYDLVVVQSVYRPQLADVLRSDPRLVHVHDAEGGLVVTPRRP